MAVGLVVSALLAAPVAAAAPHRPAITPEFEQPFDPYPIELVAGGTLFVAAVQTYPTGQAELTAYRHGQYRWRAQILHHKVNSASLGYAAGIVTMTASNFDFTAQTTAYDATTGQPLWHAPVAEMLSISDDVILTRRFIPDPNDPGPLGLRFELAAMNRRTGETLWTQQINERHEKWHFDSTWLAQVTVDGQLTVLDLRTGRVTARRTQIPVADIRSLTVDGGLVTVQTGDNTLTAYNLSTLDISWTQPIPPAVEGINGCGPLLCLHAAGLTTAIDPRTATPVWQLTGGEQTSDEVDGRFVAAWPDGTHRILSAATGQTLIDLQDWTPATLTPSHSPVLLVTRTQQTAPTHTQLALAHLDTATLEPIGQISGAWNTCELIELTSTRGRLYCHTPADKYTLRLAEWQFRRTNNHQNLRPPTTQHR